MRVRMIALHRNAYRMATTFSVEDVRAVCKERDAWWTVFLVDPLAVRLTRLVANRTSITPNQLTVVAFVLGLGAAGCFAKASPGWLAAGAVLYYVGFVLDCMDGKIARLKGTGSLFGGWLDFMLDRVRDGLCALALVGGQYVATGRVAYFYLGFAILALDMLRYVNGPQVAKVRRAMRTNLVAEQEERGFAPAQQSATPAADQAAGDQETGHGLYHRVRRYLLARRVRMHLVSGIEFQMAVFIIGPLTGAVIEVGIIAGALLLAFELAIIYRFWRSHRAYVRALARLRSQPIRGSRLAVPAEQGLVTAGTERR